MYYGIGVQFPDQTTSNWDSKPANLVAKTNYMLLGLPIKLCGLLVHAAKVLHLYFREQNAIASKVIWEYGRWWLQGF